MRNVVGVRIDERLIHGQIMTSWLRLYGANTVLIIDTPSATNTFLSRILFAAAPGDIELLVKTEQEAAEYLKGDAAPGEKLFILVKTPKPLLEMLKSGISFEEIILGNMGGSPDRKRFMRNISASPEEIQDFKGIFEYGVPIYCQMVPSDSKESIKNQLN